MPDKTTFWPGRSVCPVCLDVIDARVIEVDKRIVQVKECPAHGRFEEPIYSNATDYKSAVSVTRPGKSPARRLGQVQQGCPHDCGLCSAHRQHTCVGVIEITDECDLSCPVCYADSRSSYTIPLDTVKEMIDTYVSCEPDAEVLQISGGEPTSHPQILEIMRYAADQGISFILLNTNGVRLADPRFAHALADAMRRPNGRSQKTAIYLQFDGLDDSVYRRLRGVPLLDIKMRTLANCREVGLQVTLVPTIVRGVNLDSIGRLVELALGDDNIKMVNFQPVAATGRFTVDRPERVTISELLDELEQQTAGALHKDSFMNIPCPHPTCSVCSYVYKQGKEIVELTGLIDTVAYLEYVSDRALPHAGLTADLKKASESLFSMSAVMGSRKIADALCAFCGVKIPKIREMIDGVTLISAHAFMDAWNFDLDRAQKCCVTQILPDGKMVPFCVYNVLHRGRTPARLEPSL